MGPVYEEDGFNRDTTMLVYLDDSCVGSGGTNFPNLPIKTPKKDLPFWLNVLDSNTNRNYTMYNLTGTTFKPAAGAALFWRNLDAFGIGYEDVLHAGLPVNSGRKSAVNIWTRQTPLAKDSSLNFFD